MRLGPRERDHGLTYYGSSHALGPFGISLKIAHVHNCNLTILALLGYAAKAGEIHETLDWQPVRAIQLP